MPALSGLSERLAGLALLIAATPVTLASAVVLGVTYRRFPIIAHRRIGRHFTPFWMLKLRTMQPEGRQTARGLFAIERLTTSPEATFKPQIDPRVSNWFASFCRRHSIDELPQLWHVACGQMSLIGPRPLTAEELEEHYGLAAQEVLAVKPGLSGLWQVQGRSYLSMPERVTIDLQFVRSKSRLMRLRIMLRTIHAVVLGNGAW